MLLLWVAGAQELAQSLVLLCKGGSWRDTQRVLLDTEKEHRESGGGTKGGLGALIQLFSGCLPEAVFS